MPINLTFREPISSNYIYVDPDTNNIHLLMPITGGVLIGTDNTCQSVAELRKFFGKNAGADVEKKSALDELKRYKQALQYDLSVIPEENDIKRQKQERLQQIESYIGLVTTIASHESLSSLTSGSYGTYPKPLHDFLGDRSNLYSMLLRPGVKDSFLQTVKPVFSMNRDAYSPVADTLAHTLLDSFRNLSFSAVDQKQKLIDAVKENVVVNDFVQIQDELSKQVERLFGMVQSYSTNEGQPITNYLDEIGVDPADSIEANIDLLLNCCTPTLLESVQSSLFDSIKNAADRKERLSIMTQFFLAEINIYCYANNLSTNDFGKLLDQKKPLQIAIATIVKQALAQGKSVEDELLDWIFSPNMKIEFGIISNEIDKQAIKDSFTNHFRAIDGSPHYDEFTILDINKKGTFVTHKGLICMDIAHLVSKPPFKQLDNDFYALIREESKRIESLASPKNKCVRQNFQISEEMLSSGLNDLASDFSKLDSVAQLLICKTDNNQKLFELLPLEAKKNLTISPFWEQLKSKVAAHLQASDLENFNMAFAKEVFSNEDNSEELFNINNNAIRSLYVAAVDLFGPLKEFEDLTTHLTYLGFEPLSMSPSSEDGFVLGLTKTQIKDIKNTITEYSNRAFISKEMAGYLSQEASARHGHESSVTESLNQLNNKGFPPQKFMKTLELLDMPKNSGDITYPGDGFSGYLIKVTEEQRQVLAEIEQTRSRYPLEMDYAYTLYDLVMKSGGEHIIRHLKDNSLEKMEKTLKLLEIPYRNLALRDGRGFWVNMSSENATKVRELLSEKNPVTLNAQVLAAEEQSLHHASSNNIIDDSFHSDYIINGSPDNSPPVNPNSGLHASHIGFYAPPSSHHNSIDPVCESFLIRMITEGTKVHQGWHYLNKFIEVGRSNTEGCFALSDKRHQVNLKNGTLTLSLSGIHGEIAMDPKILNTMEISLLGSELKILKDKLFAKITFPKLDFGRSLQKKCKEAKISVSDEAVNWSIKIDSGKFCFINNAKKYRISWDNQENIIITKNSSTVNPEEHKAVLRSLYAMFNPSCNLSPSLSH